MQTAQECFEKNGYVYLNDTIKKEDCEHLTKYMFDLHKQGLLEKDEQCPLSDSVYGDEVLDKIAQELSGPLSKQLGIELLPTYTYARIYRKGEVLARHKDRPSCEISGTMTLGFDEASAIWPIFFAEDDDDHVGNMLHINVGDLVMYRGCDKPHWRPKYKGNWQVQVFFHFVDANGPHKDWKFDRRPKMGIKKGQQSVLDGPQNQFVEEAQGQQGQGMIVDDPVKQFALPQSQIIHHGVMIRTCDNIFPGAITYDKNFHGEQCFTDEECDKVLEISAQMYGAKSTVGSDSTRAYNKEIREVDTYDLGLNEQTAWIFNKIAGAVATANAEYYRYDLLGITHSLQLLHYKAEDEAHYSWHIDAGMESSATRKISASIPISKAEDYEGGELQIYNNGVEMTATKERGSITMFPSYQMHRVTPITKGERWVIVVWVHGPNRFR